MTQAAHQSMSERIGLPMDSPVKASGRWSLTDRAALRRGEPLEAASITSQLHLQSDGRRTVVLVSADDTPYMDAWAMIESDDPAVATFIEQMVTASRKGRS